MSRDSLRLTPFLWVVQSRAFSYNSGIIISDGNAVLIDPGMFPDEIDEIAAFVQDGIASPSGLILTHTHWDHILGPERLSGWNVIMHSSRMGISQEQQAGTLGEIERWENENGIERVKPFAIPVPDQGFRTSMKLQAGAEELELRHAPGHWPDEIVILHRETGLLWAGDMLSDIEIPFVSHSLVAYEQTLAELSRLNPRVLVPGHGSPTSNPAEINRRLSEDAQYLAELRRAVEQWIAAGKLPETGESLIAQGFRPSRKLEANLYPHSLNIRTVWRELGGVPAGSTGWGSN